MSYKIYDKFRAKVISTYETKPELEKAFQRFTKNDDRYEILEDKPKRKPTKKAVVNEEESD